MTDLMEGETDIQDDICDQDLDTTAGLKNKKQGLVREVDIKREAESSSDLRDMQDSRKSNMEHWAQKRKPRPSIYLDNAEGLISRKRLYFTPTLDIIVLKEVLARNPWGTRGAWTEIIIYLRSHKYFPPCIEPKTIRDRTNLLIRYYREGQTHNLRRSGTAEEYAHRDRLLQKVSEMEEQWNKSGKPRLSTLETETWIKTHGGMRPPSQLISQASSSRPSPYPSPVLLVSLPSPGAATYTISSPPSVSTEHTDSVDTEPSPAPAVPGNSGDPVSRPSSSLPTPPLPDEETEDSMSTNASEQSGSSNKYQMMIDHLNQKMLLAHEEANKRIALQEEEMKLRQQEMALREAEMEIRRKELEHRLERWKAEQEQTKEEAQERRKAREEMSSLMKQQLHMINAVINALNKK